MSKSQIQFTSYEAKEIFRKKLHAISARPEMYTPHGSFQEVALYINAFMDGAEYPKGYVNLESGMDPFARWLLKVDYHTFHISKDTRRWEEVLLDYCDGDEQLAISKMGSLYEDYLSDTHS